MVITIIVVQSKSQIGHKYPSIEIFTCIQKYSKFDNKRSFNQIHLALSSWTALPQVKSVVILGLGEDIETALREFNGTNNIEFTHEAEIDADIIGRPLFNSMIYRATASTSDISIFVNSDIILLDDLITSLNYLYRFKVMDSCGIFLA